MLYCERSNGSLYELEELIIDQVKELVKRENTNGRSRKPTDELQEIASETVPVYNGELLFAAYENPKLALVNAGIGGAYSTPISIISDNIYEHLLIFAGHAYREATMTGTIEGNDPDELEVE